MKLLNLFLGLTITFTLITFFACDQDLNKKADQIHAKIVSIDTHTDSPFNFFKQGYDVSKWNDFEETHTRVDFPRMKYGKLDAVFMAVFTGQRNRDEEGNTKAKNRALEIFKAIHEAVEKHPEMAEIALNPDDVYRLKKEDKRAVYIGVENGYPIGNEIENIKEFYDLGARYITLCHSRNNDICDSSTDKNGPEYDGLSPFGEQVVHEMNRLGMIVDVSHISDSSFFDVLKISNVPVIASHSSVRTICGHNRNLSDEMLFALKENNGVIQICILSNFLKTVMPNVRRDSALQVVREKYNNYNNLSEEENEKARAERKKVSEKFPKKHAAVSDVVDHIDYVVNKIGIDYVGIGTDFDGGGGVDGCKDASELKNITIELLKRGYKMEEIRKIWGENFLRVFREVQEKARV